MATTKGKLTEVIMRRLSGGNRSVASKVWPEEIQEAIGQILNGLLKTDHFGVNLPAGETLPTGYVLAIYEGLIPEEYKDRSKLNLPAFPILLPRGMGIFHVGPEDSPDCFYVPAPAGMGVLMDTRKIINPVCGILGAYELKGSMIIFDRSVPEGTKLSVHQVVMDMKLYGEYDPLPIPADMEAQVIDQVVQKYMVAPPADKVVDAISEPVKTQRQ